MRKILIGTIVTIITILLIATILITRNDPEEEKPIEITQRVCYMPRDCFKTEKGFLDQFPNSEVPKYYPECLIYCYK